VARLLVILVCAAGIAASMARLYADTPPRAVVQPPVTHVHVRAWDTNNNVTQRTAYHVSLAYLYENATRYSASCERQFAPYDAARTHGQPHPAAWLRDVLLQHPKARFVVESMRTWTWILSWTTAEPDDFQALWTHEPILKQA
jgi:hypothetical protein